MHAYIDHMSLLDFIMNITSNREDHLAKLSYIYFEDRGDRIHRSSDFIPLTN